MTPKHRQQISGLVESRMSGEVQILPVIFAIIGLIMWFVPPKNAEEQFIIRVIAAQVVLLSIALGLYLRRYYVRADDRGLIWHIPFRKGSCAWHEVTDYYYLPAPQNKSARVIEIGGEKVMLAMTGWTQGQELEAMIRQHTSGRLGYEWAVRGTRDTEKFPYTFRYNIGEAKSMVVLGTGLGIVGGGLIASSLWSGIPRNAALMGWGLTLTMSVLGLFVMGMPIAMVWLLVGIARETLRRGDESITVDKEGITCEKGTQYTHIPWEAITYASKDRRSRLSTRTVIECPTATITFTTSLREYAVLSAVLGRYVPQAVQLAQAEHDEDDTKPYLKTAPDGGTLYHYRTRTLRALLWMPLFFTLTIPLTLVLRHYDLVPQGQDSDVFLIGMGFLLLLFTAYGYWRYRTGGIRTTREGIYQKTLRGERFLSWASIEDFSYNESVFHIVGHGTHLRFWETITRRALLMHEIYEMARNCNGQKWERRPPRISQTKP